MKFGSLFSVPRLALATLLVAALLVISQTQRASTGETILALPFENISGQAEYNWIGEGFSLTLAGLLETSGLTPLEVEERNLAYERLGLSTTAILTRATAIKIGEKAGADLLVVGTYNITGEGKGRTIAISARVIDLREGRAVGNDYTFSGPIGELQQMQGKMAWDILYNRNPALPFSREQMVKRSSSVPPAAFESYIKAVMTPNKEDKIKFLFRALSEFQQGGGTGQYTQAVFTLGHLYYDDGNFKDALKWLERINEKESPYLEAQFYRGVAYLQLGDTEKADLIFKQLTAQLPLYEVFNNAAVAALKKGNMEEATRLLGLAMQAAPHDDDLLFNYGFTLWRAGQYPAAANQLNQLVRRQNKDGQAYYLLGKSLEKMNQKPEAANALNEAKKHLTDYAKWETSGKVPALARVKEHFSRAAYHRLERNRETTRITTTLNNQLQLIETLLAKAQGYFIASRDNEAVSTLNELLRVAPDNAAAHLLMGRIQERRGDLDGALNSLKAAVFWNQKLVPAHVLLGRIYLQRNNRAQAEVHMKQALESDPQDRDALALKRLITPDTK